MEIERRGAAARKNFLASCVSLLLSVGLAGCTVTSALWAANKPTDQFLLYAADPRVLYEPGAEKLARTVAQALPAAIQTVEQRQYRKFARPVTIYVCASIASFKSYGAGGREGGFVLNKRLFISPKPENTAERIPSVLTHELSHLQIAQQLKGSFGGADLPVWFLEGLAVYVAGGGGAETVSEEQARQSIAQGKRFTPEARGGLFFRKSASSYGLTPHMFYRQAAMFIAYLKKIDESKFKTFLLGIEDGKSFAEAFRSAYGTDVAAVWRGFVAESAELNRAA